MTRSRLARVLRDDPELAAAPDGGQIQLFGVCEWDQDLQIVRANPKFYALAGSGGLQASIAHALGGMARRYTGLLPGGSGRRLLLDAHKVQPSAGQPVRYHGTLCDITELSGYYLRAFTDAYHLSAREQEILGLVLQGNGNEQIGEKLFLSIPTVKKCLSAIYTKTGTKNQRQLLQKIGLIGPPAAAGT